MERLSRQTYYMEIAKLVAKRSTCPRASVGAVLVDSKNHIVATGYNGAVRGMDHCLDVGCLEYKAPHRDGTTCLRTVHAELNALLQLESKYENLTLYCTHQPCAHCLKALVNGGVRKVYYLYSYEDVARDALMNEAVNVGYRDGLALTIPLSDYIQFYNLGEQEEVDNGIIATKTRS